MHPPDASRGPVGTARPPARARRAGAGVRRDATALAGAAQQGHRPAPGGSAAKLPMPHKRATRADPWHLRSARVTTSFLATARAWSTPCRCASRLSGRRACGGGRSDDRPCKSTRLYIISVTLARALSAVLRGTPQGRPMTLAPPAPAPADPFLDAQVCVRDHIHGRALQLLQRARQQVVRPRGPAPRPESACCCWPLPAAPRAGATLKPVAGSIAPLQRQPPYLGQVVHQRDQQPAGLVHPAAAPGLQRCRSALAARPQPAALLASQAGKHPWRSCRRAAYNACRSPTCWIAVPAGPLEVKVTSAEGSSSAYQQATLTVQPDPSCRAVACELPAATRLRAPSCRPGRVGA
jgi:hypothetical protein